MIQPFLNKVSGRAGQPALFVFAVFFGGWLALSPVVLRAQDRAVTGPPQEIGPARGLVPPLAKAQNSGTRSIMNRPGMNDGGIQVGVLSSTEEANVGLFVESTGGFAADMWAGSQGPVIEKLLIRLPVGTPSKTVNDLGRRLLLSAAALPEGVISGGTLLDVRFEKLLASGRVDDINQMSVQVPDLAKHSDLARIRSEGMLLQGQSIEACQQASDLVTGRDQPFWLKLRTFCFALAGETAAADLTADLMREKNINDPLFFAALTRMTTGAKLEVPDSDVLHAIHLALLAEIGQAPSTQAVGKASAGVLAAITREERLGEDLRLLAAIEAERRGSLPASQLGLLYDRVNFKDKERANALTVALNMAPARANALFYQVVKAHTVPSARAEALSVALDLARSQGLYAPMARLYWPVLSEIVPSEAYGAVGLDMVRLALVNGAADAAYSWTDFIRLSDLAGGSDLRDARILLAAAAPSERLDWRGAEPLEWLDSAAGDANTFARLARDIALLEGLGYPVTSSIQTRLLDGPLHITAAAPSPALGVRLKAAASAGRVGEAVLLSLLAVGEGGPAGMAPSALLEVSGVLSRLGLGREARELVFEALLAAQTAPR